jgi:TolB-like protein/Flp pilus assembly protein TadD/class 3 adenylate cyclase
MSASSSSEVKLEIGHVLFIDIVGYSNLLITQQSEQLETLRTIVRGAAEFRGAEAEGKLLRLPTGDGGALVFRTTPETPVLCALEIARELKKHPELHVRMGIHSGPVNAITDLNEQSNIAGAGINIAQRVMDCGDAGHILLSKHVAEDLEHYPRWQPYLHDLGDCEVKHGVRVSIVNLYADDVGNAALPARLAAQKRSSTAAKPFAGFPTLLVAAAMVIGVGVAALIFMPAIVKSLRSGTAGDKAVASSILAKSIAVLPFESLSEDKSNAYFAEGVQDEILTRLAKVADLKVISRTSTQQFNSAPQNLPQIAKQLGVAHILEGSVQKVADQVRVNVQLINALTDAHLWAETYDRKLTDIFAVESDIAKTIADTLQAKLSGSEKTEMAKKPTENSEAYELYLKGRFFWNKRDTNDLQKALGYFEQAAKEDPNYALAWSGMADVYVLLPLFGGADPADAYPKAKEAANKAIALDPDLAEPHADLGLIASLFDFDFALSIREFEKSIALNPNYATAHHWFGDSVLQCIGDFNRAIAEMKRALELDPLSVVFSVDLGIAYYFDGRYQEGIAQMRKALDLDPNTYYAYYNLGELLEESGDFPGAISEYKKSVALDADPYPLALLGRAEALNGNREAALKILQQLAVSNRYVADYSVGLVYLGLGDKNQAMDWFEKSFAKRQPDLNTIRFDPLLRPLHGDPRFEQLAEKILPARELEPLRKK